MFILVTIIAMCGVFASVAGETLYNGIVLPDKWPPAIDPKDENPVRIPYLEKANIPAAIPIDVGRQLFVDDFLVESTTGVVRAFYKPVKYIENPVMWPQTATELANAPGCCMPGGAVWWDPTRRRFRMWYLSGWSGPISIAESEDGLKWERPAVAADATKRVPPMGSNVVLPDQFADTFSVWPDYAAANPYANWKLCVSPGGNPTRSVEYVSSDGVNWTFAKKTGWHGDSTTLFYNPFRQKWVWSLRSNWRKRSRIYHEHSDFFAGADWNFPLKNGSASMKKAYYENTAGLVSNSPDCYIWLACDNADATCTMNGTVRESQMYNVDATPYESVMIGLFKVICGHDNDEAAIAGLPKTTFCHFGYSRDGFHFSRPDRTPAISPSGWGSGAWDTGYIGFCSSGFVIKDEQLWIYYVGARGDGTANNPPECVITNGMHLNFSVGIAKLRRDGFAGMVADGAGELVTRPVTFTGSHLFVNADARFGALSAEVIDADGKPFPGYAAADCDGLLRVDATKRAVSWKGGDLSRFAGKPVRFRFKMKVATLYAFWVSKDASGKSGGYLAAGGPDYAGLKDE